MTAVIGVKHSNAGWKASGKPRPGQAGHGEGFRDYPPKGARSKAK